jgi:two-component system chemotaxis response regulator CheB
MQSLPATELIDAVVIGASAGGIEALSFVLPAMATSSRVAAFVVVHLPRDQPSLLPEIFSARCAVAVREAMHDEPVRSGTVYFAPPDYHLLVDEGPRLALSCDEPVNFARPAIDVLFESAADVYGARLLAILLSGGNQDGAAGMVYVQAQGGLTIVQQPASAQVAQMPLAALSRMTPDAVLSLPDIAQLMRSLPNH